MAKYVDGFVLPVPQEQVEKYREIAQKAGEIWKELGALEYFEAVGDDLEHDKMVSFRQMAGCSEEETVIFAWIVYESKEARDKINEAVMKDPRMAQMMDGHNRIFDYQRMAYGGFQTIVEFS